VAGENFGKIRLEYDNPTEILDHEKNLQHDRRLGAPCPERQDRKQRGIRRRIMGARTHPLNVVGSLGGLFKTGGSLRTPGWQFERSKIISLPRTASCYARRVFENWCRSRDLDVTCYPERSGGAVGRPIR